MTDAHCHVSADDASVREFLIGRDFVGIHPWFVDSDSEARLSEINARLHASSEVGVGEIGLDRLHTRDISAEQMACFTRQLELAAALGRPVVLHGAKCWGRVFKECERFIDRIPAFLFHGFSRSDGLLPDIFRINGYISVGPAVLNDHAVNYRALVNKIPVERLLLETDRTETSAESISLRDILVKVAELRAISAATLEAITDNNAEDFFRCRITR